MHFNQSLLCIRHRGLFTQTAKETNIVSIMRTAIKPLCDLVCSRAVSKTAFCRMSCNPRLLQVQNCSTITFRELAPHQLAPCLGCVNMLLSSPITASTEIEPLQVQVGPTDLRHRMATATRPLMDPAWMSAGQWNVSTNHERRLMTGNRAPQCLHHTLQA